MPLLQFYHPANLFTTSDKQTIATKLTSTIYKRLPAFYVNVQFIPLSPDNFYVGGKSSSNHVRIVLEHIAHHTTDKEESKNFKDNFEAVIRPFVQDKGMSWEFCVLFGQQHLWRIDGIDPPLIGEDDIEVWREAGKPVARS